MRQVFVWLLLTVAGFAQGGIYNDIALDSTGRPAAGASVRVCSSSATGTPCSPTVTVYSDSTLSTIKTSVVADTQGNFWFYGTPGPVKLQVTKSGSTYTYTVDVPIDANNATFIRLNNIRYADQFSGANAGAKMIACLADLPAGGGICDARGLEGSQSGSSTVLIGTNKILLLGNMSYTVSTTPAFVVGCIAAGQSGNGAALIGNGIENTYIRISGTGTKKFGVGASSCSGANSSWNRLEGFTVDMQGTSISTHAIALGSTWFASVKHVRALRASNTNAAGLYVGTAGIYVDAVDGGSYLNEFEDVHLGAAFFGNYYGLKVECLSSAGNNYNTFRNLWSTFNTQTGIYLTSGGTGQAVAGTQFIGGGSSYNISGNGISLDNGVTDVTLSALDIESNGSWGITNTSDTISILGHNVDFSSNVSGNYQKNAQYIDMVTSGLHEITSGGTTPNTPSKDALKVTTNATYSAGVEQRTPPLEFSVTSLSGIYQEGLHATNDISYLRWTNTARTKAMWFDPANGRLAWNYAAGIPAQFWLPGASGDVTFPSAGGHLAAYDVGNAFSIAQTFNAGIILGASGTTITAHYSATASLDFAAWAGADCQSLTLTVSNAADGNTVELGVPTALATTAGVQFTGFVSSANTVTVRGCKITAGASADPAAATVRADVWAH